MFYNKFNTSWEISTQTPLPPKIYFIHQQTHEFRSCAIPFEESSSIGCLNAVMSLNVHRKSTTFSCSFRIGAIFTKNHTGVPEKTHTFKHSVSACACTCQRTCDRCHGKSCFCIEAIIVLPLFYTFMHIQEDITITNLCTRVGIFLLPTLAARLCVCACVCVQL